MNGEPRPDASSRPGGRLRWAIGIAAVVVVLAAGTWVAVDVLGSPGCVDTGRPKSYQIKELREGFEPRAVSPDGRYIAGRGNDTGRDGLVLWHDGEYTEIDAPGDAASRLYPTDVNNAGVVVGTSNDPDLEKQLPWRYQDGESTVLSGPDGEPLPGTVDAVAADGTAVGQVNMGEPLLWPENETKATRLPLPEPEDAAWTPLGISDTGVVVSTVGGKLRVWDGDGKARVLGDVSDDAQPLISRDWVLAGAKRWNLAEDREHPKLDAEAGFNAVDSCGRGYGGSGELDARPILDDGKVRRLPELDPKGFERDEPETPYGTIYAASADGSVLIGASMGRGAIWTYE